VGVREAELTGPVDPDIDLHIPAQRRELADSHGVVLAVMAAGGGIGGVARYGAGRLWPTAPGGFSWATLTVNAVGCMLIGVLMVLITEVWVTNRLARPFLGVGVLGGFTTFSTYTAETRALLRPGTVPLAFAYLAGTLLAAMLAVTVGVWLTRLVSRAAQTQRLDPVRQGESR
jgi:fluoride exporter